MGQLTHTDSTNLRRAMASLPKIDLHRHLEGSLRLETLSEIGREKHLDVPAVDAEALRPYVQFTDDVPDFHGFLAKFKVLRHFYTDSESVARLTHEAVADAAADNVKYLELRFNPVALSAVHGFGLEQVTEWVVDAMNLAQQQFGIQTGLIIQIGRDEHPSVARALAHTAIDFRNHGVVGIDLAGDEILFPAAPFGPTFLWAKAQGLHITVHAGEVGPAANVREAVELLGAERIGHGVRAIEDPSTVAFLEREGIALEICPTSNQHTGVIPDLAVHPLGALRDRGVRVTINTDDPGISNITLTDEYVTVVEQMAMPAKAVSEAILCAAQSSFLPAEERSLLVARFRSLVEGEQV